GGKLHAFKTLGGFWMFPLMARNCSALSGLETISSILSHFPWGHRGALATSSVRTLFGRPMDVYCSRKEMTFITRTTMARRLENFLLRQLPLDIFVFPRTQPASASTHRIPAPARKPSGKLTQTALLCTLCFPVGVILQTSAAALGHPTAATTCSRLCATAAVTSGFCPTGLHYSQNSTTSL